MLGYHQDDLLETAREIFCGGHLCRFYTTSYIVLIPKVKSPLSFDKLRSISMCSVVYKISKIIVNKFMSCLYRIISPEQESFLLGRSIFDNITMASEKIHFIKRKIEGGNVILKIDIVKSYNRVD